jgi:predicted nucleic acid-binding protein
VSSDLLYLDSSAIVKLVVREPETVALMRLLEEWPQRVSSALARVEVIRAIRRSTSSESKLRRASEVLKGISLVSIDENILAHAAQITPVGMRSLDAIHVSTALSIAGDLAALVSYDDRMAMAADAHQIKVWSPA